MSFRIKCMQMHTSCNYRSVTETGNVTLYDFMHFNNRVSFFQLTAQQLSEKGEQLQLFQQQLQQTQQKLQLIQQQVRNVFLQCMHTNSTCVSSQGAEKEGEVVRLQHQLQETNTERIQLDGECHNGTCTRSKVMTG